MTAQCKGCGAAIIWAVTEAGKRIPLDAKPEQRFIEDHGFDAVRMVPTYQSHFASCPKAPEFRGKAKP